MEMEMGKVRWSDIPEELLDLIADRLSSNIDLLRIRSICKPWRSAVAIKKRFSNRFKRNLPYFNYKKTEFSPTTFFRVTFPSSCPTKGWLIKTRQVSESSKINLLSPLSHQLITSSDKTLDLFKFGVSEIRPSYDVVYITENRRRSHNPYRGAVVDNLFFENSDRVVLVDNLCFAIDYNKEIWCCKIGEESSEWTRIKNTQVEYFSDIIVHKGLIYALDNLKGAIWWISLSQLEIYQYRPSPIPMDDDYDIDNCKDKRLVECCGDLWIVHRFDIERTVDFKVYKMDDDLVEWVEVSSLGDKTLIVAMDSCFMVSASEYYGCLKNAIYFTDVTEEEEGDDIVQVFKLDGGSIINMIDSSSQSCFQMFSPPFL